MADSRAPAGSVTEKLIGAVRSRFPGTALISGFRKNAITVTGNKSMHSKAQAVDLPPSKAIFEWIEQNYAGQTFELIFSPMGARQIYKGKSHVFTGAVKATHFDHIHWSMTPENAASLGGGATVPVSNPVAGIDIPGTTIDNTVSGFFDGFTGFFTKGNGARRLAMIAVGVGMVYVSVNITFGRKIAGVASGVIGR